MDQHGDKDGITGNTDKIQAQDNKVEVKDGAQEAVNSDHNNKSYDPTMSSNNREDVKLVADKDDDDGDQCTRSG